ncbi:hypothetical protein ACFW35_16155 [Fictibacillus sp. NPDC058756]|uniref:hypothetical protein n=1 Tax=Fictibacillus sp. NPDC058756 TaxID=3346625 RepID=UPI003697BD1B
MNMISTLGMTMSIAAFIVFHWTCLITRCMSDLVDCWHTLTIRKAKIKKGKS